MTRDDVIAEFGVDLLARHNFFAREGTRESEIGIVVEAPNFVVYVSDERGGRSWETTVATEHEALALFAKRLKGNLIVKEAWRRMRAAQDRGVPFKEAQAIGAKADFRDGLWEGDGSSATTGRKSTNWKGIAGIVIGALAIPLGALNIYASLTAPFVPIAVAIVMFSDIRKGAPSSRKLAVASALVGICSIVVYVVFVAFLITRGSSGVSLENN